MYLREFPYKNTNRLSVASFCILGNRARKYIQKRSIEAKDFWGFWSQKHIEASIKQIYSLFLKRKDIFFAKNNENWYSKTMNEENTTTSSITDEDAFHDIITSEREKRKKEDQKGPFIELENALHESLTRQDSEHALTLITRGSLALGSSDIHYDTSETTISIRLRIDGELVDVATLSRAEYKLLLERLKYKSDLKLNITDIPQDGKYRITENNERIDVRVSTLPVRYGENVVCRILDSTKSIPKVEDLGFMWTSKRQIEKSMNKKNGTILVTGPTGSGKTTTLYSMLTDLNTREKKIITLEDPIEYELPGVIQSEVDEKKKYTYETGLKAVMRQDPDIIMIGEVRDLESATIAMQAAMT